MTLIISITTPNGIIMASDSRQTLKNPKQMTRISTNYANKLFAVNERIIVGTAGMAFFADETGVQRSVSTYVNDFCNTKYLNNMSVKDVATELHSYINRKYPWEQQLEASAQQFKLDAQSKGLNILSLEIKDNVVEFKVKHPNGMIETGNISVEPINLLISGFNTDGSFETYESISPGNIQVKRETDNYGCTWIGQGDVVSRMILGYDAKIFNTSLFQGISSTTSQQDIIKQLQGLEYNIPWPLLTLQDAVDLAVFLIKSTSIIQRYADGITMDGGDIQGVGGPIDVAIITRKDGIKWIKQKQVIYPSFD